MLIGLARSASRTQLPDKEPDQRASASARIANGQGQMLPKSATNPTAMADFQKRSASLARCQCASPAHQQTKNELANNIFCGTCSMDEYDEEPDSDEEEAGHEE